MDLVRVTSARALQTVLIAALLLVSVFATQSARGQLLSPGNLAGAHSHLNGDGHCNDCHTAGKQVQNSKCTTCHDDIGASMSRGTGLHGRQYQGKSCGGCHVDHRGSGSRLARWDPVSFDHGLTGWPLEQYHVGLDCKRCHNKSNRRGAKTYLGLSSACGSCHQDPHENRFGSRCQDCHTQITFQAVVLKDFDHNQARFKLRGAHQKVACAECHGTPVKYRLAFFSCGNCHEDPHAGRFGATCTNCHNNDDWKSVNMKRSAHPGLSLFGGHSKTSCTKCHDRGLLRKPSRGARCVGCHAPVHEAEFGTNCANCHRSIRWLGLPAKVGLDAHDKTPFPLKGKHLSVKCKQCHSPNLPPKKRFRELAFARCSDCHDDQHNGEFDTRDNGECGRCHTDAGFQPSRFGVELHATTKFALVGRHQAVPCGTCHENLKKKHRLDWRQKKQECASCHENPHGDQFKREMKQGGCAHCHSPLDWDLPNIEHETWPLTGAHAKARCDQCHTPTPEDRKLGRGVSYKRAPRDCEGCHQDLHAGQFRLSKPVRGCGDCHTTWKFKIAAFDHKKKTGYALEGKHARAECVACHADQVLENGETAALYRLPYSSCRDCHADPHEGTLAGRAGP